MSVPVKSPRVTQPWGRPNTRYKAKRHTGIDFGMPVGTPLFAIAGGKVRLLNDKSYGLVVVIAYEHEGTKYEDWYCHMSKQEVANGATVAAGAQIGLSGNTGNSTGPHLHLETRIAPFKYGNDTAHPILTIPGIVDPNAPVVKKPSVIAKVVAVAKPASPRVTKVVRFDGIKAGNPEDIKLVQSALVDIVGASFTPNGKFGPQTQAAYKRWQEKLGYKGSSADGVPGRASLIELGKRYGFTVI